MAQRDDGRTANMEKFQAMLADFNHFCEFLGTLPKDTHAIMTLNLIDTVPNVVWAEACASVAAMVISDVPKTTAQFATSVRYGVSAFRKAIENSETRDHRSASMALWGALALTPEHTMAAFSKMMYDNYYP